MVWKPKERELTREEAIAEAKKLLAPLWYHSGPLFTAAPTAEGIRVFPIEETFSQGCWLISLLDPFTPTGLITLRHLRILHGRHAPHELSTVVILRSGHEFARDRSVMEALLEREGVRFPCCLDADGALHVGFSAQDPAQSHFRIYDRGVCRISMATAGVTSDLEREIQSILREKDAGLALRPILEGGEVRLVSESPLLLGDETQSSRKITFLGSGWRGGPQRRVAQAGDCSMEFEVTQGQLYLVAEPQGRGASAGKIQVTVNGAPVYSEHRGESIQEDDDGRTVLLMRTARLMFALNLPAPTTARGYRIRMDFPQASSESGVAVYSCVVAGDG